MAQPANNRLLYALYANGALLLAILIALLARGPAGGSVASAAGAMIPQPIAGNGSLYLMPGQLLNNVFGCYILDTDSQTLCVYAYTGSKLQLKAARNIRYDHMLTAFNTEIDPEEVRKLVELDIAKIKPGAAPGRNAGPMTQPALPDVER